MENTVKIKGLDVAKLLEGTIDSIKTVDKKGNVYTIFKKDIEENKNFIAKQIEKK